MLHNALPVGYANETNTIGLAQAGWRLSWPVIAGTVIREITNATPCRVLPAANLPYGNYQVRACCQTRQRVVYCDRLLI
jgi:hypothetical protein